jgi:hypothetical protein
VTDHSRPNKARPASDNDSFQFLSPLCRKPYYRRPGIIVVAVVHRIEEYTSIFKVTKYSRLNVFLIIRN